MRGSIALSGRVAERITAIPQNLCADGQKLWGSFLRTITTTRNNLHAVVIVIHLILVRTSKVG